MKKRILSLVLALALVMSLLPFAVAADSTQFTDVDKNGWYKSYVDDVVSKGYFKGTSATTFEPETYMTRAMFVTVLARLDGAKVDDSKSVFTDVPADAWYTGSVTWAAKNNIVNGIGDGKFAPNDLITREQMCTIMDRYLTYYAKAHNVTVNSSKNTVTFSDQNAISSWAVAAVASCVSYGLIIGTGDGSFQPARTATRAEVATVISRLAVTANAISGGSHGGSSTKTDYIRDAVEDTVEQFNDEFGTSIVFSDVKSDSNTRPQQVSFEIPVTADVLEQVIEKTALVTVTLLGTTPADRAEYQETLKENVSSAVDAAIEVLEEELGINITKSTTVAQIKAAVYEKAVSLGKSYWENFHNGEGTYYTSKVTISSKNYSVDVVVDEETSTTTITLPAGMKNKAILVSKFAADIAKDFYADLKEYNDYTPTVEVKATVNVEFADSVACKDDTEDFPHNYPYEFVIKLDAGVNGEYKFDGASYIKINVTEAAQVAYTKAVDDVIDAALETDTVKALLEDKVTAGVNEAELTNSVANAVVYNNMTVVKLLAFVDGSGDSDAVKNARAFNRVRDAVNAWLTANNDTLLSSVLGKTPFKNEAFYDMIDEVAAELPGNMGDGLKDVAYPMIEEAVDANVNAVVEASGYAKYVDNARKLNKFSNLTGVKLSKLAELLEKPTFQSYVGSYGNSTIAKVTDYLAKLPAGADVTVKVGGQTLKIDKTKLAALQASTGTVDACNALADIVDDLSNVSLSSFDTNEGAYITATAKGRTYGFHLVICFDSNHIH